MQSVQFVNQQAANARWKDMRKMCDEGWMCCSGHRSIYSNQWKETGQPTQLPAGLTTLLLPRHIAVPKTLRKIINDLPCLAKLSSVNANYLMDATKLSTLEVIFDTQHTLVRTCVLAHSLDVFEGMIEQTEIFARTCVCYAWQTL